MEEASPEEAVFPAAEAEAASQEEAEAATPFRSKQHKKAIMPDQNQKQTSKTVAISRSLYTILRASSGSVPER